MTNSQTPWADWNPVAAAATLRRSERREERCRALWLAAAEKALTVLPEASRSDHPAHALWIRVEMAKAPPVQVVLSERGDA